ncbi:hypothetical protein MHBO_005182 [Bonamia ostreae]|uniref:Uncharacterized protein n=1 Tax=Bonamia ostreae TaxID=126728 RepID=A0ABV2AVA8_9EUKA
MYIFRPKDVPIYSGKLCMRKLDFLHIIRFNITYTFSTWISRYHVMNTHLT